MVHATPSTYHAMSGVKREAVKILFLSTSLKSQSKEYENKSRNLYKLFANVSSFIGRFTMYH